LFTIKVKLVILSYIMTRTSYTVLYDTNTGTPSWIFIVLTHSIYM